MFHVRLRKILPYVNLRMGITNKRELDYNEVDSHAIRYKPQGIDSLCKVTKFTKKELQIIYRGFKQECPTGVVNEETFKHIYSQFFPQSDTSAYAHYVFRLFDEQQKGSITFEDFVVCLSILARGSMRERMKMAFNLYDLNKDGVITREEMHTVISSIYGLMGKLISPSVDSYVINSHVDTAFQKLDINRDGVISLDEFLEVCMQDSEVANGVMALDTFM